PAAADRHPAAEDPHHRALRRQRRFRAQRGRQRLEAAQPVDRGVPRAEGGGTGDTAAGRHRVMSWSTASDLRAQVMRLWERGELLREGLPQDSGEPPRACLPEEEGEGAQSGEQPSDAAADTTAGLPAGRSRFPLRLSLKTPTSDDITRRFDAVRAWVAAISATPHVRLEWQETRHRVQGSQRLPASAWVDRLDDALAWIGKRAEH